MQTVPWNQPGYYQSRVWRFEVGPGWVDSGSTSYQWGTLASEAERANFREAPASALDLYLRVWRWDGRAWVKVYESRGVDARPTVDPRLARNWW